MAPIREREISDTDQKVRFQCCKTRSFSSVVCVVCGKVYHNSCATRDFPEKVKSIDKARIICCQDESEVSNTSIEMEAKIVEIVYLKKLIKQVEDNNQLLQENAILWKEKYDSITKEKEINPNHKHKKQKGKQNSIDCDSPTYPRLIDGSVIIEVKAAEEEEVMPKQQHEVGDQEKIVCVENPNNGNPDSSKPPEMSSSDKLDNSDSDSTHGIDEVINQNLNNNNRIEDEHDPSSIVAAKDVWQVQKKRGFKQKQRDNLNQPKTPHVEKTIIRAPNSNRPAPIMGVNEDTATLKAAVKMAFLFLSGLAPEVSESLILKYLQDNNLETDCRCEKIKTKRDKYRASFRLTVPYNERHKYLCPMLWPKGVIINHFMNLQHL